MQDLTRDAQTGAKAYLVTSSMSAGNTVSAPDAAKRAMTAPGSASILPPSPTSDNLVNIPAVSDEKIPVSFPGTHDKVAIAQPVRDGGMPWTDMHDVPKGSRWKETQ